MSAQPTLINSVIRALRLLDLVADEGRPVSAKKLARLSDVALPTTYHLLRTLVHEGYLSRTNEGYTLGDRPHQLAQAGHARTTPQRVHSVLRAMNADLDAAAYLAVLDDGEVRLAEIVDSPAAPRADLWVGLHESAHATALGKAVLGALTPDQRVDYLARHPLVDLTQHTHTNVRSLLAELEQHPDFSIDSEEYALGTTCLAVRVPSPQLVGAVAVSAPTTDARRLLVRIGQLRRAAHLVALAYHLTDDD